MRITEKRLTIDAKKPKVFFRYSIHEYDACLDYDAMAGEYIGGNAVNKLGENEDIEDKLGIEFKTLFSALFNGIYVKDNKHIVFVKNPWLRTDIVPYSLDYSPSFGILVKCPLASYGKTWALTKKELKK